jgi:hypothetical protein
LVLEAVLEALAERSRLARVGHGLFGLTTRVLAVLAVAVDAAEVVGRKSAPGRPTWRRLFSSFLAIGE